MSDEIDYILDSLKEKLAHKEAVAKEEALYERYISDAKVDELTKLLAAERALTDELAEALRNEQRYHYLRVETVNLLAEHDRKREQER